MRTLLALLLSSVPCWAQLGDPAWLASLGTTQFSPSDISGLVAWWDANTISGLSDGENITTWSDLSSNGYTLAPVSTREPTYETNEVNGLPAVQFDGSSDVLTNNAVTNIFNGEDLARTVFLVGKKANATSIHVFFCASKSSDTDTLWELDTNTNKFRFVLRDDAGTSVTQSGTADVGSNFNIYVAKTTGTVGNTWINGTADVVDGAMDTGSLSPNLFTVGARGTTGAAWQYFLAGLIAEIIIYDSALSDTDRGNVQAHLATKYGISLP